MKFSLSQELKDQLKKIKQKNPKLFKKIHKQLELFLENDKHPSLRLHKLKGVQRENWSISINDDLRILFYINQGEAVFFVAGTHDQVYREKK